jgi:hypothetical protein
VAAAGVAERAQGAPVQTYITQRVVVERREDAVGSRSRAPDPDGSQDRDEHIALSSAMNIDMMSILDGCELRFILPYAHHSFEQCCVENRVGC